VYAGDRRSKYFGEGVESLLRHILEKMAAAERRPEQSMGGESPCDNLRRY